MRGLGKARLQVLTPIGWKVVARIHPTPSGRFTVTSLRDASTQLRLAYNTIAGDAVALDVEPRLAIRVEARSFAHSCRRASRSRCSD